MTPHQRAKIRHLEEELECLKERWAEYILDGDLGRAYFTEEEICMLERKIDELGNKTA